LTSGARAQISGLAFQLYYEASYLALDAVSPVTHSLGNNLKRIIIVISPPPLPPVQSGYVSSIPPY
jgi:hypothetical protein